MMQCTDFEKQVIAEAGVLSQEQQKHLLACKSCQDFLRVYGLALAPPAPSAKLDAAVRRQVAGVMRWQRQRRRLIRFGQALLGAAAVLVLSTVVWRLMAPTPTPPPTLAATSSPASAADYWLLECALTDAALDDLETDLGLQAALDGDFRVTATEVQPVVSDDLYRDLSNQLLMLEFDLDDSL
ncbi:MAG TPA: hypothetical protein PLE92_11815 [Lentisphaeria bacterium]|nr:hypothetical protein [Lentisphaerota bacterium]HPY90111.1 hypothetical protein [Lentisphaeria bacterium]HQC53815.1 hypothetical protein [Lentisphaeria bacterium]HQL88869.1 hypothetical protein [Lentisphaeria bacterium]